MNPIGMALDALVLALLVWALALGLKLNTRLKALREGQDGFAKAVAELDVATRRAQTGLAEMRRSAEETHDALLGRIETARGLLARLDAAGVDLAARAPSVAGMSRDGAPARPESARGAPTPPLPRRGGGGAARSIEAEGARALQRDFNLDAPAPAGFADLIRRTLKEPR